MPASYFRIGFLIAAAVAADAALAQRAETPEPGLWQLASKIERNGAEIPQKVQTLCLSPEDARAFATQPSLDLTTKGLGCRSDSTPPAKGETLRFTCSGSISFDGIATYTLDTPHHYTIVLKAYSPLAPTALGSTLTLDARRIGPCEK